MREAEIKVPEELSDVIARALQVTQVQNYLERADAIAKAVLSWQREHPPVPTDEQAAEIFNKAYANTAGSKAQFQWAAREWIRRMYDAPEPEVPEEIKDLLSKYAADDYAVDTLVKAMARGHNADIIEAYRRGLGNSRQTQKT